MGAAEFGKEDVEIEVKENTLSIRVRSRKKNGCGAQVPLPRNRIRAFGRPSNLSTMWK
jgi:HSP20 family molecular chaperone IbpA